MPSAVADKIAADMQAASFIREMFEKGRRLMAEYGPENVYDFSLGNPNAPPPDAFFDALRAVAADRQPARHRYMPNAGFDDVRAAVAAFVAREYRLDLGPDGVILTSGAAGGMNCVLRAICNPGDEVIVLAPYFPEYRFYIEQAGGRMVLVQTDAEFQPDLDALATALTERTRAVLINSPNNPTGAVYTAERCAGLARVLARHDRPDRPLYLVCDDPYRRILYGLDWCPTPVHDYPRTVIVSSYSKDLSIPGERAGYIAVPPAVPERPQLLGALTMLNRTLGYVNAPALIQRVLARCAHAMCDLATYRLNRDLLCSALCEYGYALTTPRGALYAFPQTPIADDVAFSEILLRHRVLVVPGSGFGRPGHVRIAFCVERETIRRALPAFRAALTECRGS